MLVLWLGTSAALASPEYPRIVGRHPVLVTIDDLPISASAQHPDAPARERITRQMLAVLKKHRIPAVGFVTWKNVTGPADRKLLEAWLDAGHELGNHTDGHPDYTRTGIAEYVADADRGRTKLAAFLEARGRKARYFRFPFLREGNTLEKLEAMRRYLEQSGQVNVPVTLDNQDWSFEESWVKARKADDLAEMARLSRDYQDALRLEIRAQTVRGDELFRRSTPQVLLLHATEVGAAQWDALFSWMEGEGFTFAKADELLSDAVFTERHGFVGAYGGSHWGRLEHERRMRRAEEAARELLQKQAEDWNRGDLVGFASAYAEDAMMVTPTGSFRGREAILQRYQARPMKPGTSLGILALEPEELRPLWGPEVTALGDAVPGRPHSLGVVARWTLRQGGADAGITASGRTVLVLQRLAEGWKIVQDASF